MYQVIKRDGTMVDFDISKISGAIVKAFDAVRRQYHPSVIDLLALRVCSDFDSKIKDGVVQVEDIQDSVEKTLINADFADVAKAYILYRKQREKNRDISAVMGNYGELVRSYLEKGGDDAEHSASGLIASNSGAITANYWLHEVYDEEVANAHRDGDIRIRDLSMLSGYRSGWSLKDLIEKGIAFRVTSLPAKHLDVLADQMVRMISMMQNEWSGAQTLSHFDTYLAPFVRQDKLKYDDVKRIMESFLFGINTHCFRDPYISIMLDWTVDPLLKDLKCVVGGRQLDFTYGECQKEVDLINKALIDAFLDGDGAHDAFDSPIPIYSLKEGWDKNPNASLMMELIAKRGTPRFSNEVLGAGAPGAFFVSEEYHGSLGVVSINMPRLAYVAKNHDDFFERFSSLIDLSCRCLEAKKAVLETLMANDLYPYTSAFLSDLSNHALTVSLSGVYDMEANASFDLDRDEVLSFASSKLKAPFDLEIMHTSHYFASLDQESYPEIRYSLAGGTPAYLGVESAFDDVFAALDECEELEKYFNTYLEIRMEHFDPIALMRMIDKILENYHLRYFRFVSGASDEN